MHTYRRKKKCHGVNKSLLYSILFNNTARKVLITRLPGYKPGCGFGCVFLQKPFMRPISHRSRMTHLGACYKGIVSSEERSDIVRALHAHIFPRDAVCLAVVDPRP